MNRMTCLLVCTMFASLLSACSGDDPTAHQAATTPATSAPSVSAPADSPATTSTSQSMHAGHGLPPPRKGLHSKSGTHTMDVTVTTLDRDSGIIEVHSVKGDMDLRLHYPPATLRGVEVGDIIVVHLALQQFVKK